MRKVLLTTLAILGILSFADGQIYYPMPATSSGNNNVGINQSNPLSRLHISDITTFGQCTPGLLIESSFTSQVTPPAGGEGGGEEPPADCTTPYALRNTTLTSGVKTTTYDIAANGQTQIGNLSGVPVALNSFLSVEGSLGVYNTSSDLIQLGLYPLAGITAPTLLWSSNSNLPFRVGHGTGSNFKNVMTLTTDDFVGINTSSPEASLHVVSQLSNPNGGETGQIQGLLIENNGYRNHDYALEIRTGQLPHEATMTNGRVFTVSNAGTVHIGEGLNWTTPGDSEIRYRLYVQGGIRAEKVRVDIATENEWADYVFDEDYVLMPWQELENYIKNNKHLPGVPSTSEVLKEGVDLAEMNKILLEKVEELTLRVIQLEKKSQPEISNKSFIGNWKLDSVSYNSRRGSKATLPDNNSDKDRLVLNSDNSYSYYHAGVEHEGNWTLENGILNLNNSENRSLFKYKIELKSNVLILNSNTQVVSRGPGTFYYYSH